jgi:hypothetical protein
MTLAAKKTRRETAKRTINRKLVYAALLVTSFGLIILSGYYLFLMPRASGEWRATIVDQLSIDENLINTAFIEESTSLLNSSGFEVDYYDGGDVNIDFYRNLPTISGKISIVRAHSSVRDNTDYVDLFTSELFQPNKYLDLASERQISKAQMYSSGEWYFAIGPTFVELSAFGRFENSLVILMGCSSLNQTTMAEALVAKGASVVIGWTDWIELGDTDEITLMLFQYLLLTPKYTVGGAVEAINQRLFDILGHYPSFGARLAYHPSSAKNQRIQTREESSTSLFLRWAGAPQPALQCLPPNCAAKKTLVILL